MVFSGELNRGRGTLFYRFTDVSVRNYSNTEPVDVSTLEWEAGFFKRRVNPRITGSHQRRRFHRRRSCWRRNGSTEKYKLSVRLACRATPAFASPRYPKHRGRK